VTCIARFNEEQADAANTMAATTSWNSWLAVVLFPDVPELDTTVLPNSWRALDRIRTVTLG